MIRHAGRAAALFAVSALFVGGAWAQELTMAQTATNPYLVAEELLGSADGTVVQLGDAGGSTGAPQPAIRLKVPAGGIAADNTAEITFSLTGAVFGENVGGRTLDLRDTLTATDAHPGLSAEVISGGNLGDSSITFLAEATAAIDANEYVTFWLPDLRVTPAVIGTNATTGAPELGVDVVATVVEKRAVKSGSAGPFVKVSGARDKTAVGSTPAENNLAKRQVLALADVVNISMGMGPNVGTVALAARTRFAVSNATYTPPGSSTPTSALRLGTLTVTITGDTDRNYATAAGRVYTLDPDDPAVEWDDNNTSANLTDDEYDLDSSLAGNVDVVVKGAFKSGDLVVYGPERTKAKMSDGMAAVSIPITGAGSSTEIIYVPGGVETLRPGDITAMAMLNFSRAGNAAGLPAVSVGRIEYAGIKVDAYAHGVVKGGGTDKSFLRVRCASATDCTVFLDCHDEAGDNYFDEAGTVGGGETAVWNSDDVATVLSGGWSSGRGACDLLSSGTLEVQHMVRSGHTLINSSAVVGRSLSEAALASIDKVVNDICSAVVGHKGRTFKYNTILGDYDGDANTPATYPLQQNVDSDSNPILTDDVSAIAATACKNVNAVVVPDTTDTDNNPANGF